MKNIDELTLNILTKGTVIPEFKSKDGNLNEYLMQEDKNYQVYHRENIICVLGQTQATTHPLLACKASPPAKREKIMTDSFGHYNNSATLSLSLSQVL